MIVIGNGVNVTCKCCHKDITSPCEILVYHGMYFCDNDCLGSYLVEQAEDEIEIDWVDTPENMKICALEDRG